MRQLGKGHSVMFFAPGEVDRRIRSLIPTETAPGYRIQASARRPSMGHTRDV